MLDVWVDIGHGGNRQKGLNERWARGETEQGQTERRQQREGEVRRREWVIDGAEGEGEQRKREGGQDFGKNRSSKQKAKNRVQVWKVKKQVGGRDRKDGLEENTEGARRGHPS